MFDVIFIIAVLIGVISAIGNAVVKIQRRAGTAPGMDQARRAVKSRPAVVQHDPRKAQPVEAAPLSGTGSEKIIRAPSPSRRRDKGKEVRDNLGRIFREEEQLRAAFIFHEVLGPPRSLRRR